LAKIIRFANWCIKKRKQIFVVQLLIGLIIFWIRDLRFVLDTSLEVSEDSIALYYRVFAEAGLGGVGAFALFLLALYFILRLPFIFSVLIKKEEGRKISILEYIYAYAWVFMALITGVGTVISFIMAPIAFVMCSAFRELGEAKKTPLTTDKR